MADQQETERLLALRRERLDQIDTIILRALANRFAVAREIAEIKAASDTPMAIVQPERHAQVVADRRRIAEELGLDGEFAESLIGSMLNESVRMQLEITGDPALIVARQNASKLSPADYTGVY